MQEAQKRLRGGGKITGPPWWVAEADHVCYLRSTGTVQEHMIINFLKLLHTACHYKHISGAAYIRYIRPA